MTHSRYVETFEKRAISALRTGNGADALGAHAKVSFGAAATLGRRIPEGRSHQGFLFEPFERRRELALLSAVGYRRSNLATMILAENALILIGGLAIGASCALIAIIPAIASRGGHVAALSMVSWLGIILVTGLAAVSAATFIMVRQPLLASLRSE